MSSKSKPKACQHYQCYIYGKPNHKIYDCPHKVTTQVMSRNKNNYFDNQHITKKDKHGFGSDN